MYWFYNGKFIVDWFVMYFIIVCFVYFFLKKIVFEWFMMEVKIFVFVIFIDKYM